jgi:hypothetical protein
VIAGAGVLDLGRLPEHSVKPVAAKTHVLSTQTWKHAFGEILIETCADGSVWIDGKPVIDTLPSGQALQACTQV